MLTCRFLSFSLDLLVFQSILTDRYTVCWVKGVQQVHHPLGYLASVIFLGRSCSGNLGTSGGSYVECIGRENRGVRIKCGICQTRAHRRQGAT